MQLGLVVGTTNATVKHPSMDGQKLLIVQPLMHDGVSCDGHPFVVVDVLGAGPGDEVMITSDGKFTRSLLNDNKTPVRWTVQGIRD